MLEKPKECCLGGTYEHCIPTVVRNKVVWVDFCVADIVVGLNAAGLRTVASCCGHDKMYGNVMLEDGRSLDIRAPMKTESRQAE